jgi:hypothetical protein
MTEQQIDSLIANEFALELDGTPISGIFSISGLRTYATDENGDRIKPPFEIAKMVQRNAGTPFNSWLRETIEARGSDERPTRTVTVVAVDDGVETRRWQVSGAWIKEVRYSDFDSSSFEMVAETCVIAYEDISEEWPASDTE